MKSLLGALLLIASLGASAQQPTYGMEYLEPAIFFTAVLGQRSGKVVCLENTREEKTGMPEGWYLMTCASMHDTQTQWQICYVNPEKKSFICGVKPS